MKLIILITHFLAMTAFAQVSSQDPPITVLKKQWTIERVVPPNSVLNTDPFEAGRDASQLMRERRQHIEQNAATQTLGRPPGPPPSEPSGKKVSSTAPARYDSDYRCIYQIAIKNTGARKIKSIEWDYVFFDPGTNTEVGRKNLVSATTIRPSQTRSLKFKLGTAPTPLIDTHSLATKTAELYREEIVILKITYTDGSTWSAPPK
jgi:hypothetical protein